MGCDYLLSLPTDVLLQVVQELDVRDILALRQTCRYLAEFSRERSIWHDALYAHVLDKGLPVPGLREQSIVSLTAEHLEDLTHKALKFHRNWTSANPAWTRRIELFPIGLPERCSRTRTLAAHFIPGRGNQWLLTVTIYDQEGLPRRCAFHCWDILSDPPRCVAVMHRELVAGAVVNSDPSYPGILAISHRIDISSVAIYAIDFSGDDPESAFKLLKEFPSRRALVLFQGRALLATDSDQIVRLMNVDTGELQTELCVPLEHDDPTRPNEEQRCLGAVIFDHYIVTFCYRYTHLYSISCTAGDSGSKSRFPVASHKWPWRIDSLVACPRYSPRSDRGSYPLIDILMRFDSYYPWPVNILHHFVLPSNPDASWSHQYPGTPTHSSPAPASSPLTIPLGVATSAMPQMARSIDSPVRLFTPSNLMLGTRGTALWLDTQGNEGRQRIAGCILRPPTLSSGPSPPSTYVISFALAPQGEPTSATFVEAEGAAWVYSPAEGGSSTDAGTMVFHVQMEDDSWTKVEVDEEEGRIAVGTTCGKVLVFEYAPRERDSHGGNRREDKELIKAGGGADEEREIYEEGEDIKAFTERSEEA
ncbi:hypothetical protein WOLCODRAFT_105275 [Wolfiporia cocos MD-104 SS10]|uniref:F-box domain-containing protein n=1 Tax=Wolfiporia cocos (strain MD-104) TaxID=742152 RepID=A0A2H3JX32_WOLCO|nr:hypothetical protein WOLCODRAFT_105275 [Wolfiporia cocos MD-104 SS10]